MMPVLFPSPKRRVTYTQKVIALSPIAYWPMAEASGSTATDESGNSLNGAYTGVTLGSTGIGDGRTAATLDGTTSFNNIYSAGLNTAFNNAEMTIAGWLQVTSAGVWSDAANRAVMHVGADITNNFIRFIKTTTASQLQGRIAFGATLKTVAFTVADPLTWQHFAVTASKSGDAMKVYLNGVQQGSTQTTLGTWAGALSSVSCGVGCQRTSALAQPWAGNLAHMAVWASALSAAQIATLAVL